eukprot:12636140-Ditylum_brightwellii.AAC.1
MSTCNRKKDLPIISPARLELSPVDQTQSINNSSNIPSKLQLMAFKQTQQLLTDNIVNLKISHSKLDDIILKLSSKVELVEELQER